LNAGDLLQALVQQLPLNSPTLVELTGGDGEVNVLERLLETAVPEKLTERDMTLGEGRMTAALELLEILLLQLGGYGCVPPIDEKEDRNPNEVLANHTSLLNILKSKNKLDLLTAHMKCDICKSWEYKNQSDTVVPRLGMSRLKMARAVEGMILLAHPEVDELIASSGVLEGCFDLFFKFEWCSLLHQSVANLLVHIIEGGSKREGLQVKVVNECGLLGRLLDCFKADDSPEDSGRIGKLGYMGHVIIICQAIVHACSDEEEEEVRLSEE